MTACSPARLKETIADCQNRTKMAHDRLVKTFGFVPDDKLSWSLSETARSPLAIVAHCILANQMLATVVRGEQMSSTPTPEEAEAASRQFESTMTDRADAVRQLEASCEEAVAALGTMTTERFASSPDSPFGAFPMPFWMNLPAMHMNNHASQIDYIQTAWGDQVDHW